MNSQPKELFSQLSDSNVWVEVILPLALPRVYTYSVPSHLQSQIIAGIRVEVIFATHDCTSNATEKIKNMQQS